MLLLSLSGCILSSNLLGAGEFPEPLPAVSPAPSASQRYITMDFDDVDIRIFIKFISELSGKNFVIDKAVRGNVTIISPEKISEDQAYRVFESVLDVHGFTTVQAGSVIKILPAARARTQNIDVLKTGIAAETEDRIVTQLVPLRFSSPAGLKKILTPLLSQTSVLIAHEPSRMLIITETLSNIQKLLEIVDVLDVRSRDAEIAVVPLENGLAGSLAKILSIIYQNTGDAVKGGSGSPGSHGPAVKIVPYERTNSLVIVADSGDMVRVKSLVRLLDTRVERAEGNIHVYYLQNATAGELAKVLNTIPRQQEKTQGKGKKAAISRNVQIMADEETNSLIITASREEYAALKEVIQKLDIPRRMVFLEALIMEVDANKSLDVGVEWSGGGTFDNETGTIATGFSGQNGYNMLGGITAGNPSLPNGYAFGVLRTGIRMGNVVFPSVSAMLRAHKTDDDINVISTPQILTTDNKKAEISVGRNVPYITSQNTSASDRDYTQYEYRDVATRLSITPHINRMDALRLEIEAEVIRLSSTADTGTPTTFKRTASTTVILNDQDTVVIGGIIGHDTSRSEWKVPFLGDIPGLGWLFKTHSMSNEKTNMFIFITPRIVRNPADLASVTYEKQDVMEDISGAAVETFVDSPNPEHAAWLVEKGYQELEKGAVAAAGEFFRKALAIDSGNPYALINLAVVHERSGRGAEALKVYQQVIEGGYEQVAGAATNPDKIGYPLVDLAWEGVKRVSSVSRK